jgi:hypothetical protein
MNYLIQSGLPDLPADQGKDGQLLTPVYQALNTLARNASVASGQVSLSAGEQQQLSQVARLLTQNHNVMNVVGLAALAFGKLVHLKFDGVSKIGAELADSTNSSKPANGIVIQTNGISLGGFGDVLLFDGYTDSVAGSTIGQTYYLGASGNAQVTRPSASGSIVQAVGVGLGTAGFLLRISSLFLINP